MLLITATLFYTHSWSKGVGGWQGNVITAVRVFNCTTRAMIAWFLLVKWANYRNLHLLNGCSMRAAATNQLFSLSLPAACVRALAFHSVSTNRNYIVLLPLYYYHNALFCFVCFPHWKSGRRGVLRSPLSGKAAVPDMQVSPKCTFSVPRRPITDIATHTNAQTCTHSQNVLQADPLTQIFSRLA